MKRPLTQAEEANVAVLRSAVTDIAFLYLTPTGLNKALLDAILPVRTLLASRGIHRYDDQQQGPCNRVVAPALLLEDERVIPTNCSMYRPVTKRGDPRIWFSQLAKQAAPNDILALFVHGGQVHIVNLTRSTLASLRAVGHSTETLQYLDAITTSSLSVATELLGKLKVIAAHGPLPAVCRGDTAIGRTIELALGLQTNSSKKPDYKGIEIKSAREKSIHTSQTTRATLFAQVPNWNLSRFKSSRAIIDAFGYDRPGCRKLYCTVAIEKPNSQGLQLSLLRDEQQLEEIHPASIQREVVAWELSSLHGRLQEKHRETFWIKARSLSLAGKEHFALKSVRHTRAPSLAQFDDLLDQGAITVDHLIKTVGEKTNEKGPLFKLPRHRIPSLFLAEIRAYEL